ncbi:MAG: hypothetical protein ACHP7M_13520 [Burkholderiales bacterium]
MACWRLGGGQSGHDQQNAPPAGSVDGARSGASTGRSATNPARSTPFQAMTPENDPQPPASAENERLIMELEQAEAYEQKLRQLIVAVRDRLAAGHVEQALSMLNTALNDIDSATDVVVPSPRVK